jgi:peptidoglycan/LPS O-acetylase OafA/YrhL
MIARIMPIFWLCLTCVAATATEPLPRIPPQQPA